MIKIHFESLVNLNGPIPRVTDSREGTAMWEVSSAALGDGCNTALSYLVENIRCIRNAKIETKTHDEYL